MRENRSYRRFPVGLPFVLRTASGKSLHTTSLDCAENAARLRMSVQDAKHFCDGAITATMSMRNQVFPLSDPSIRIFNERSNAVLMFDAPKELIDPLHRAFRKSEERSQPDGARLKVIRSFTLHVLLGTMLFAVVFLAALGVERIVVWLSNNSHDSIVVKVATAVKHTVLFIDSGLYVIFLVKSSGRLIRRL
jgi:hypothetical protein